MLDMKKWQRFAGTFAFDNEDNAEIESVRVEIVADDSVIRTEDNVDVPLYVTDVHFQAGAKLTGWQPETREFYKKLKHTNKETATRISKDDIYLGGKVPIDRTDAEFREYNITGRGHEVFVLPNWYPDDWYAEVLPTGVDFVITPKNDYDLFRLCTNYGTLKNEEDWYNNDPTHPLSMSYTKEFTLANGKKDMRIQILASTGKAYFGSNRIPIGGVHTLALNDGSNFPIKPRGVFLAQEGAVRFRIEFYKFSTRYIDPEGTTHVYTKPILIDSGIGFQGTAKFNQWTYGGSRV